MHWYFRDARQINQSQIYDKRRENCQVYGFVRDTFTIRASDTIGLLDNLLSYLIKICHFNTFSVKEFAVLCVVFFGAAQ